MCAAVYRYRHLVRATKVNAGLAESNGKLLLGIWRDSLHVTCGLTACTPGSAPGPTLGNEYGKTLPFYHHQTDQPAHQSSHSQLDYSSSVRWQQWCAKQATPQSHRRNSLNSKPICKIIHRKIPCQICIKVIVKNPTTIWICCHITLLNINVRKQAINDKLQGSVASYLRCGGVANDQIKKDLLLSLSVIIFKSVNTGKVTSKNVIVSCTFFIC